MHVVPQLLIGRTEHAKLREDRAREIHRAESARGDHTAVVYGQRGLVCGNATVFGYVRAHIAGHIAGVQAVIEQAGAGHGQRRAAERSDRYGTGNESELQLVERGSRILAFPEVAAREYQQLDVVGAHIGECPLRNDAQTAH